MKTIYCPACGVLCNATPDPVDGMAESILARCPSGHGWAVMLNFEAGTPDGTSMQGFQCDGTPAYELPESAS